MFLPIVVALIAVLATYLWRRTSRPKNFPPGPIGLPFIGSVLSMGSKPQLTILKWKEKYGDTFSFSDGNRQIVVLSEFNTLRKVFGDEASTGRKGKSVVRSEDSALPLQRGLILSDGPLWKTHRRFALSALRDLGMGKNWLEDSISQEVAGLLQGLKDSKQQPFDPKILMTNSVANVICALAFGKRFPIEDPKLTRLTTLMNENLASVKLDLVVQTFPCLMWFPNFIQEKISKAKHHSVELADFMREVIAEHRAADRNAEVEDYIFAYEKEKESGTRNDLKESFDDKQLISSLFDLFAAGTDTTSTTALWSMIFMIEHPEIMRKVQDEIDSVVGRDRMLTNGDRGMLPYTEAMILEVQRVGNLLPLSVLHSAEEDMTIDGFTVPKGTVLAGNLFSIHRDPRYWTDPLQFNPPRFLDENQKLLKPDGFAPFSIGKRVCLGESLAKMELFLFIANILRCFTLELPPGTTLTRDDYYASIFSTPNPFKLIFVPRN